MNIKKYLIFRKHFGVYEKVLPVETTPSRIVPLHIERPSYIIGKETLQVPTEPEIKDANQISGMRRSCKLAASILKELHKIIQVLNIYTPLIK